MRLWIFNNKQGSKTSKGSKAKKREAKPRGQKFSDAEKQAYRQGQAFAKAKAGQTVTLKTEAEKKSFRSGMESVKARGRK